MNLPIHLGKDEGMEIFQTVYSSAKCRIELDEVGLRIRELILESDDYQARIFGRISYKGYLDLYLTQAKRSAIPGGELINLQNWVGYRILGYYGRRKTWPIPANYLPNLLRHIPGAGWVESLFGGARRGGSDFPAFPEGRP
jgi:hypothetical protein